MKSKHQNSKAGFFVMLAAAAILMEFLSLPNSRRGKVQSPSAPPAKESDRIVDAAKKAEAAWAEEQARQQAIANSIPKSNAIGTIIDLRETSKYRPEFSLLSREGSVSPEAVKAADLSDSEADIVGRLTGELLGSISNHVKSSTKRVPNLSTDKLDVYRIKSFVNQSEDDMRKYLRGMSDALGDERAWKLAKSLPVEQIAAGFGTQEAIYRIVPPDGRNLDRLTSDQVKQLYRVEVDYRDPSSGESTAHSSTTYEDFNRTFLNALD